MKRIILLILFLCSQGMINACTQNNGEINDYKEDQKAYDKCLKVEDNSEDCIYKYVEYLPEHILKEME